MKKSPSLAQIRAAAKRKRAERSGSEKPPQVTRRRTPKISVAFADTMFADTMRTKLFGLRQLQSICTRNRIRFLSHYGTTPKTFSLANLKIKKRQRLLIRSDPITKEIRVLDPVWQMCPRKTFDFGGNRKVIEARIKQWMKNEARDFNAKTRLDLRFFFHVLRPSEEYHTAGKISIDLRKNKVSILLSDPHAHIFRASRPMGKFEYRIDALGRITHTKKKKDLNSQLKEKAMKVIKHLIKYNQRERFIETSFVTYRDKPTEPEFYDLLYGKQ